MKPCKPQPRTPAIEMMQNYGVLSTHEELEYGQVVYVGTPRGLRGFTVLVQELVFDERGDVCPYAVATLGHACGKTLGQYVWDDPDNLPQLMSLIILNALWHCEPFDEIFTQDSEC